MKTIPFNHVRQNYANGQPAGHWFSPGALKFFKCQLPASAYETRLGIMFVTRGTNPSGEKRYTVRRQDASGDIYTIGKFHHYATAAAARAEIKRLDAGLWS